MSRQALRGIGQVIKDHTTEKSIDDLRAEGKKRVRVVSSDRVMAIIQAIVDDTIASEVGEIAEVTKRDRDRIVSDTQERFSRVLRMQQDLEQQVDDLRASLRGAEAERDRLRTDKSVLEAQLDVARRADGETDGAARVSRDLARVRDCVERLSQAAGPSAAEVAIGRLAEELAARDAHSARRLGAGLDELREKLAGVGRDATASRDAAIVTVLERVTEQQARASEPFAARLDKGLASVAEHIADLTAALDGSVRGLRGELAAVGERVNAANSAESDAAAEVLADLRSQAAASAARAAQNHAALAARFDDSLADLRSAVAAIGARLDSAKTSESVAVAEALGDLRAQAAASAECAAQNHETLASRFDDSLSDLRGELTAICTRLDYTKATESVSVAEALGDLRAQAAASAERAAQNHAALAARFDDSVADLRGEFGALAARNAQAAERQQEATRLLAEQVARGASAESDAMRTSFEGALEQALDKITRTMQLATARPIEMTGEATDALLSKIFDDPDHVLTSNYDQLDVEQRRAGGSVAKSVDRLKKMTGLAKAGAGSAE